MPDSRLFQTAGFLDEKFGRDNGGRKSQETNASSSSKGVGGWGVTAPVMQASQPAPVVNPSNGLVFPGAIMNYRTPIGQKIHGEQVLKGMIDQIDGYGRQANAYDKLSEAAEKHANTLNTEFMEKYGSTADTSSSEFIDYQLKKAREYDLAKAQQKAWGKAADQLRLDIAGENGDGWLENVRTLEDFELLDKAYRAGAVDDGVYRQMSEKMAAPLYEREYSGRKYADHFLGQTQASYVYGKMGLDSAEAWNRYYQNPTADNRRYAETVDRMMGQFAQNNRETLAQDAALPWISQNLAGYAPQLIGQTKSAFAGGLIGGGAGLLLGAPVAGRKVGAAAAIGKYSYDMVRGAAFRTMLQLGIDEKTARAAANDEAILSSVVEMADAGLDLMEAGISALIKGATKSGGKMFLKTLGKYGINIFGEGIEESLQSFISTANQRRVLAGEGNGGTLDLLGDTIRTVWNAITGKDAEAAKRARSDAKDGMIVASMLGGEHLMDGYNGQMLLNGLQGKILNQQTALPKLGIKELPAGVRNVLDKAMDTQNMAPEVQKQLDTQLRSDEAETDNRSTGVLGNNLEKRNGATIAEDISPEVQKQLTEIKEAYQDAVLLNGVYEDSQELHLTEERGKSRKSEPTMTNESIAEQTSEEDAKIEAYQTALERQRENGTKEIVSANQQTMFGEGQQTVAERLMLQTDAVKHGLHQGTGGSKVQKGMLSTGHTGALISGPRNTLDEIKTAYQNALDLYENNEARQNEHGAVDRNRGAVYNQNNEVGVDSTASAAAKADMQSQFDQRWRALVKAETSWSDTVISYINTIEEARIYMNAGLKETNVNGRICLVREISWDYVDKETGMTNRERVKNKLSPCDAKTGEVIVLHHMGQRYEAPFVELLTSEHGDGNYKTLHPKRKSSWRKTGTLEAQFKKEKRHYWKTRIGGQ